jgi:PAS domain S-box-containing protein
VNEEVYIKAGLEIALKLHPNTKQVVVVNDLTTTGIKVHEKLVEVIENYQNSVNFVFLEDIEMPELQEKIQRLGSDSLVFYTLFFRDKAGKFFEYDESITLIASKCNVPIYGTWDFSLSYGIVRGMLASGFYQGETAAKLALRVLRGENISNIPVVKESPNRFMFDYKQLERFGIKLSDLPKEKIVINQPVSFYTINKTIIWAGIGIFIILLIYVITLTINTFRRRRAERSLRESEERFRQMAENTKEVFWLSSLDGSQLLYINPAYEEVWGRSGQSQYEQPKSWLESVHPEDYDRMLKVYERYTQGGFGQAEFRIVRPNGEIRWIASRTFPVRNEQGVVYRVAGINVDITDLKLTVLKTLQDTMVTLAHYIRNANTVIGGFAARLLKHTSDDDTKQHLQLVHQASKEIDAVINSLQHLTEVTTARYTKDSRATMIDLKKELEARLGPPRKQGHIDEPSKKL